MKKPASGIAYAIFACVAVGALAALCVLYDLVFPNHFVGDMYGVEVMMRVVPLAAAGLLFAFVSALCIRSVRRVGHPSAASAAVLGVTIIVLVFFAVGTVFSRRMWDIRARYPGKSVEELVSIARNGRDQFAVYALGSKGKDAVHGLLELLLDESVAGNIRQCAAQGLGRIGYGGNPAAVRALEEARSLTCDANLRQAIDDALESAKGGAPPRVE